MFQALQRMGGAFVLYKDKSKLETVGQSHGFLLVVVAADFAPCGNMF